MVSILQEHVEERSVALTTKATKITAECLAKLMKASYRQITKSNNAPIAGKQSVKQLSKGGKLESVEISSKNIKAFEPFARKFGINYALHKDTSETPPKWLVFFQSKDSASMNAAFKEFMAKTLKKGKSQPSVKDDMAIHQEKVKNTVRDKTKNKDHGEHER